MSRSPREVTRIHLPMFFPSLLHRGASSRPSRTLLSRIRSTWLHARWWTALVIAAWSTPLGQAFEAEPDYYARTWRTEEGLPHNIVGRCVQDRVGFMWFGTAGGLARFDGREFKGVPLPDSYRTGEYNIRALVVEKPGTLLILPASGGLMRVSEGKVAVHPLSALFGKGNDAPADLFVDRESAIWVSTYRGALWRWTLAGELQRFAEGEPVAGRGKKFTFAQDEAGNVWVAAERFLAVYRDGRLLPHRNTPESILLIAQGAEGKIWVASESQLLVLERGQLRVASPEVPWMGAFAAVRDLFEDHEGALWIARSRGGLLRYAQGQMRLVPTPYASISQVTEDRDGSLWLATDGDGVGRMQRKSHWVFNVATGLGENTVSAVCEDATGRVWLANRSGGTAVVLANGLLKTDLWAPFSRVFANSVGADLTGRVWFGGGRSGLYRSSLNSAEPPEKMPLPEERLHLLQCVKNGDMWFSADPDVLGFYHDGVPRVLGPGEGDEVHGVRALAEDPAGNIWVGTHNGELAFWDGQKMKKVSVSPTVAALPIHDLHADGVGELWIATAIGLARLDHGQLRLFTEADGLADSLLLQVTEDASDRLWINSRRGLFCVSKSELQEVARGVRKTASSRIFGRDQGLASLSPIGDYHPKKWRGRDGLLWFATVQGAIAVDPSSTPRERSAPPVMIDEVRLDGAAWDRSTSLRVPSGAHRLEFLLVAPSFTSADDVEINYRLSDTDLSWIDAGNGRMATYTNLSPGTYHLDVIARHQAGRWSEEPTRLEFTIVPAWWETLWARSVAVVLFTALTAWIVRAISQRVLRRRIERLEQEHALEKERVRIARDLHDELGSGLTELGLLAERIARVPPEETSRLLGRLATRTRRLSADLSGIVWTMSGSNGRLDRLAVFLGQYVQRLFRHTGVTCVVQGIDAIPPIPIRPEPQYQLLTATKEALNNVLKHAGASAVEIRANFDGSAFELSIRDDGSGFEVNDAVAAGGGNGLHNMRTRLEEIGGTFTIESRPGTGTLVRLRFPLSGAIPAASTALTPESPASHSVPKS